MKIGLLLAHSGPAALWRLGCEACAQLAAAEINLAGGVLDAPVELISADSGADPAAAARAALALRDEARVDVVVGMQLSNQRAAVRRALDGRIPYIYTPHYEGGWCGPATIALGLGDGEALGPALDWLTLRSGARRIFFVGNDYIWPRTAHGSVAAAVRAAGGRMAGEALLPIGAEDFAPVLSRIRASRADAVVVVLIGDDAVRFHRAFSQVGYASRIARLSLGFDETLLWAVGPEHAEGLHAVQPYFMDCAEGPREAMLDRYHGAFGATRPPVNGVSLNCYDGVRLAAALAGRAGCGDGAALARSLAPGFGRRAAIELLGRPHGGRARPPVILAEADGAMFRTRVIA